MASPAEVLVVEDETQVRELVSEALRREGYGVRVAADGSTAAKELAAELPDIVLLDLGLPGIDGFEILQRLRAAGADVPVIVLTARGRDGDRVRGLELGADDYVVKPVSTREIVARVRAVLRRVRRDAPAEVLEHGSLTIDLGARRVTLDGEEVEVPPREFDLLAHLAQRPGVAFSRADLLREVWGSSPEWQDPSTVTVHVRRLRNRVEPDPTEPQHLVTVYGVGYRFDP
ncbi:MAG: response regulator transcription factor [Actinomycetota bacterium]